MRVRAELSSLLCRFPLSSPELLVAGTSRSFLLLLLKYSHAAMKHMGIQALGLPYRNAHYEKTKGDEQGTTT